MTKNKHLHIKYITGILVCAVIISGCRGAMKKLQYMDQIADSPDTLFPVDDEISNEENATDMSIPIMEMLNQTGYCRLAAGVYYVRRGIDIPEGATLEGCGNKTEIRLLNDAKEGYCIRISKFNTIRDIKFSGGVDEPDISSTEIGGRNGVEFVANRDGKEETSPDVSTSILTGCWFENFKGSAIYGHNSGGWLQDSLIVSDCVIHHCEAGINLDYYTEYHKFSNIIVHNCHYACINNGGNNTFVGCTFHGTVGFLIDNSKKDKKNSAHGSAIGCTFNHIDNWNHPDTAGGGIAVGIYNTANTFCFEGCQIWHSSVVVEDSKGICFDGCAFSGTNSKIHTSDLSTVYFTDCIFYKTPDLEVGDLTEFSGCHLRIDGEEIQ